MVQLKKGESKLFQSPDPLRSPLTRVLLLLIAAALASTATAAPGPSGAEDTARSLQRVLDRVKARLGLEHSVVVVVVPADPFLVSVEAPQAGGAFVVRVERRVLELLTADELEAALAHELGHVWVFTHHPYLQTEQLANDVAMRVVSRNALARVYEKVWQAGGAKGNLSAFLGAEPATAGGGQRQQH